jgi:glutaredoxin
MSTPPPLTPADARATVARRTQSGREKRGAAPEVILYYADWCGYCKKAQKHLDRRGVPYDLRDVDVASVKKELRSKTGRTGIPVMDVDGRILQGYRASSYDKFLDTAGL